MSDKKHKCQKIKIIIEPTNLFQYWCCGVKIRIDDLIDRKQTKAEMIAELKNIKKLFE